MLRSGYGFQARGEPIMAAAECAKNLKRLSNKLDSLVPYLTLALSAYQVPTTNNSGQNQLVCEWEQMTLSHK